MSAYIFILLCILPFSYCYSKSSDISLMYFSKWVCFLILFIPAAIRYDIGTDYHGYVDAFNKLAQGKITYHEGGYALLNKVFINFGLDVQWVFATMSFLTLFFLFKATPRGSFYIIIPFFYITYFIPMLIHVRQSLVVIMAYYAYQLLNRKKIFYSFIIIFIGYFFHSSALIYYLIFLIILSFNVKKKLAIVLMLIILSSIFYAKYLINVIFTYIVANITRYSDYITSEIFNRAPIVNTGFGSLLRYLMVIMLIMFIPNKKIKEFSNALIIMLAFLLCNILASSIYIFGRASEIFLFAWFPMTHLINIYYSKYRKMVLLFIFIGGCLLFIAGLVSNVSIVNKTVPYKTIFYK